ncbi:MAG: 4Fe-4S dicluster domain-containing protein [Bacteroidales bacterium]|nr:4Fe-4S dicluster domain-containing protein [Bacteroidales bacterium]
MMNIERKLLTKSSLGQLVQKLNQDGKHVYAPVRKNEIVNFEKISALNEMDNDYIVTVESAKSIVFPRVETLFKIETSKDIVTLKDRDLSKIPEVVLLGGRPCDAAGFGVLSDIFKDDYKDTIFEERLNKTTLITISCTKSDYNCFCASVGINPGGTEGSDILLTPVNEKEYYVEVITEKGKIIIEKYPGLFESPKDIEKEKFIADVPVAFDINIIKGKLFSRFDDDIWIEQSLRCIGCGTCAFVCPTCGCFDIQDDYDGHTGKRKRSWDSCGFDLFTLHSSGHNPRSVQSQRWRQRVLHKFEYMPQQFSLLGCVGCGRCSRACSANMNLKEHLINLAK